MSVQSEDLIELNRIRNSQLIVNDLIHKGEFQVPVHLALGHEALAVSVSKSMAVEDQILLNHRNIHYQLALGATVEQLISEYKLQIEGLAGGQLGSMNLVSPQHHNPYTSNILGNNLAVALGIAQAAKMKSTKSVTWVVTGDGAIEEGIFYESVLCATSWKLPIVFLIENNGWSLGTEISERRIDINLEKLSHALGCNYLQLSGNKLTEYISSLKSIRQSTLENKPVIVEVLLTTLGGYYLEESNGIRYINYHAGKAKIVTSGMVICEDDTDPVYANLTQQKTEVENHV